MAQGHGASEATRIARQELGMVELHKDAVHSRRSSFWVRRSV